MTSPDHSNIFERELVKAVGTLCSSGSLGGERSKGLMHLCYVEVIVKRAPQRRGRVWESENLGKKE